MAIRAVILENNNGECDEKYNDDYQEADRTVFPTYLNLEDALSVTPANLANILKIQKELINFFPDTL